MKKLLVFPLVLLVIVLASAFAGFVWWNSETAALSTDKTPKRFIVTRGSTTETIAANLQKEGLIKNSFAFKLFSQINGVSTKIQAGEFRVSPSMSIAEVIKVLLAGPVEIWVTIPEGLRREQVSEKFADSFELEGDRANMFRSEFLTLTKNDEGYLFPETYLFAKDASPSAVVNKLKSTFVQKTKELNLTPNDVILASILERETRNAEEGPLVAGILLNRLNIGMALQADATAQYAIGSVNCDALSNDCTWWKTPTASDLQVNSPFNTYKYPGLPPSPISSPGLSMLKSAVNPQETDYLYYIHDSEGVIHPAETLTQHNANVVKYLR